MMNKNKFIGAVMVLVFIGGVYLFTHTKGGVDDNSVRPDVVSDDGQASLVLPESVDKTGISITKIDPSTLPESFLEDGAPLDDYQVYDLSPSGLQMDEPATFYFTQEIHEASIPLLYHIWGAHDEHVEIIDDTLTEIDLVEGTVTVSGDISHFSKVAVQTSAKGPLKFTMSHPAEVAVGESVDIKLLVEVPKAKFEHRKVHAPLALVQNGENFSQDMSKEEYIQIVQGRIEESRRTHKILSPSGAEKFLTDETIELTPENKYNTTVNAFSCAKKGETNFLLRGAWRFQSPVVYETGEPHRPVTRAQGRFAITYPYFTCIEAGVMMHQIDPPSVILQAGTAPLGEHEAETGYANEDGVKMYNGKPVANTDYLDGIEPVR